MTSRLFSGRALAGLGFACAVALSALMIVPAMSEIAWAQDEAKSATVRPEIGKPLKAAQEAVLAKKYGEALAHLKEAEAISGKTPYEEGILEQLRLIAAVGGEEPATAAKAFAR